MKKIQILKSTSYFTWNIIKIVCLKYHSKCYKILFTTVLSWSHKHDKSLCKWELKIDLTFVFTENIMSLFYRECAQVCIAVWRGTVSHQQPPEGRLGLTPHPLPDGDGEFTWAERWQRTKMNFILQPSEPTFLKLNLQSYFIHPSGPNQRSYANK